MRYALLVHDSGLSRVLSCTNQRVWPVTHDSSFDEPERNGMSATTDLGLGVVLRDLNAADGQGMSTRLKVWRSDRTRGRFDRLCKYEGNGFEVLEWSVNDLPRGFHF